MKKGILVGLGILFVAAALNSGCSKPEEKKVEVPPAQKQMVQEKAAAMQQQAVEKTESAVEATTGEAASMTDQAVEAAKGMGKQAMENVYNEKAPEEVKQAVDVYKQFSGKQMEQATTEEAKAVMEAKAPAMETVPVPATETAPSLEQTMKDKASAEGMKLLNK